MFGSVLGEAWRGEGLAWDGVLGMYGGMCGDVGVMWLALQGTLAKRSLSNLLELLWSSSPIFLVEGTGI